MGRIGTVMMAATALSATMVLATSVQAETKDMKIAFSNNYAGNSWRQAMLKSYDIVTQKAVDDKIVGAADTSPRPTRKCRPRRRRSRT